MQSSSTELFGLVGTLLICLAGAVDPDFRPESCQVEELLLDIQATGLLTSAVALGQMSHCPLA